MTNQDDNNNLIEQAILDPILLQRLSEKVFELLLEDLRNQRSRTGNFRR